MRHANIHKPKRESGILYLSNDEAHRKDITEKDKRNHEYKEKAPAVHIEYNKDVKRHKCHNIQNIDT